MMNRSNDSDEEDESTSLIDQQDELYSEQFDQLIDRSSNSRSKRIVQGQSTRCLKLAIRIFTVFVTIIIGLFIVLPSVFIVSITSQSINPMISCTESLKKLFNESEFNDPNKQVVATIDPVATHPEQIPVPSRQWMLPDSPTNEEFQSLHPAYPPARFLAAFALGQWTNRFDRFAIHPNPPLHAIHPFEQSIKQSRKQFNVKNNQTQRHYCATEEDTTYGIDQSINHLTLPCARMFWYSSSQACWILSHFNTVEINGDSLMRQMYFGLLQILSGNFEDGQLASNVANASLCKGDAALTERSCRKNFAADVSTAAAKMCPTFHLDPLPDLFDNRLEFKQNYGFNDSEIDDNPPRDFLSMITNVAYHELFRIHTAEPFLGRSFPPIQSESERRIEQQRAIYRRRKSNADYQGGNFYDLDARKVSEFSFKQSMPLMDREEFVYPLRTHIGALIVQEMGYHDMVFGDEHADRNPSPWPHRTLNYYDTDTRLMLFESHRHSPPMPIFPLYFGFHTIVGPTNEKQQSHNWFNKVNQTLNAEFGPTINRHLQAQNDPIHYFESAAGQSQVDLSYLHYASHIGRTDVTDTEESIALWNQDPSLQQCRFDTSPHRSKVQINQIKARSCCSHSVRPWQFLDPLALTAHVPFEWSGDGLHYSSRINLYKAQALLNYAHILVQQHQRIQEQKTSL